MSSLSVSRIGEFTRWALRFPGISLRNLRWLALILPVVFLIGVDYLRHFVFPATFHSWFGYLALLGGALVFVVVFTNLVFATVEKMHKELLDRNRELSLLYDAAYNQTEQLKALREAGMTLSAELSLDDLLQKVVDLSCELVGARYGALGVFDENRRIERLITSGLTSEQRARIREFPRGLGIMALVPNYGKPVRLADIRAHPYSVGFPAGHPSMRTFLGVPIISEGRTIGNLKLTNKRGGEEFTQEDEDKVVMLAAQAAIAIRNARLYEQEQALAVLQERERIAQDLHDGIIQDIYGIGLTLEQCIEQAGAASAPALQSRLGKTVEGLNDIIKDVRNYIFALQPADLEGTDLVAGLGHLAREFRINSLVDAELAVKGRERADLAGEEVGQLLKIAHEALTNILKHAQATSVTIEVGRREDGLELVISDNGRGFDPEKAVRSGLGLRNIADRTRALGGQLAIESSPGKGTKLTVGVPVAVWKEE